MDVTWRPYPNLLNRPIFGKSTHPGGQRRVRNIAQALRCRPLMFFGNAASTANPLHLGSSNGQQHRKSHPNPLKEPKQDDARAHGHGACGLATYLKAPRAAAGPGGGLPVRVARSSSLGTLPGPSHGHHGRVSRRFAASGPLIQYAASKSS